MIYRQNWKSTRQKRKAQISPSAFLYINHRAFTFKKRKKVILVHDDLKFFARVLRKYNPKPAFFTSKFGDVTLRLKKLLAEGTKVEEPVNVSRNGTFDIKPMDLSYRFKKLSPKKIKISQKVGEDCYEEFILDFFITSIEDLNKLAYMLKNQSININDLRNEISSGKSLMIELKLKEKFVAKMKYKMFETWFIFIPLLKHEKK